jgi:CRISPR-associated protein Cmr6
MPIAAVPDYLQRQDLSTASPGMRFGMYLKLWGINRRSNELLWTTHDLGYEVRGQNQQEREVKYENKVSALSDAKRLSENDKNTMAALLARQLQSVDFFQAAESRFRLDALATAPFTTGLGNEHPLENGFAFLNPYGLPYLPGSGVKGVLRQAARELASGEWGETQGWDEDSITALFGREGDDGDTEHQRGALVFWDVIPQIKGDCLAVEIMTPHQTHYYQNDATPHDSGQPTPISFLTVPHGSRLVFHVQCQLAFLQRLAPALAQDQRWKTLLDTAFTHAYQWLGFGAKTAVGYGAMEENPAAKAEREKQAAAAQAEAERLAEETRRANLSPDDLAWEIHKPAITDFSKQFEAARKTAYQPGSLFDNQRNDFLKAALLWSDSRSRQAAGELLKATLTKAWGTPGNKEKKQRMQEAVAQLAGTNSP